MDKNLMSKENRIDKLKSELSKLYFLLSLLLDKKVDSSEHFQLFNKNFPDSKIEIDYEYGNKDSVEKIKNYLNLRIEDINKQILEISGNIKADSNNNESPFHPSPRPSMVYSFSEGISYIILMTFIFSK